MIDCFLTQARVFLPLCHVFPPKFPLGLSWSWPRLTSPRANPTHHPIRQPLHHISNRHCHHPNSHLAYLCLTSTRLTD
ncbi:hypothetical protein BGZ61DRAFT_448666 [Ilyonectria robusta]|uniref:uncharacterized protein n=1 Tax=Ilyonectria robusta TaxID=1079257 RepID=UPI001E8EC8DE|nr:uncharacterized protein BGZ61DRAFT_448666 [Ilyonectria robusta]KAH8714212.1 hypothetical protein BGZ61DRAFT_448666 [Ilyonectria robusta]